MNGWKLKVTTPKDGIIIFAHNKQTFFGWHDGKCFQTKRFKKEVEKEFNEAFEKLTMFDNCKGLSWKKRTQI